MKNRSTKESEEVLVQLDKIIDVLETTGDLHASSVINFDVVQAFKKVLERGGEWDNLTERTRFKVLLRKNGVTL